jgi:hypothetical protein
MFASLDFAGSMARVDLLWRGGWRGCLHGTVGWVQIPMLGSILC